MEKVTDVILSLGSNQGDRLKILSDAIELLSSSGEIDAISRIYETPPWGFEAEANFLNLSLVIRTKLSPENLLNTINRIEEKLGRIRSGNGYASRTIDIDIITFGTAIISTSDLTIPHPRFQDRLFVLMPLIDIAPNFIDPITNLTFTQLYNNCVDNSAISLYENQPFANH